MRNPKLSPRGRAVMFLDGGPMNVNPLRWFQATCLAFAMLFGLVACDPDADGTPTADDCAPNNPGGGQISECDCPDNLASPASCREDDSPPADDTAPPDEEVVDEDGDGIEYGRDCDDFDPAVGAAGTWYYDDDGDGFGLDSDSQVACDQPSHYVEQGGDCNDNDASINPDAIEECDGVDQDCDGLSDEDEGLTSTFFADDDGDGWGDPNESEEACALEDLEGFVGNSEDCDDGNAANSPDGEELCDGADNDCDNVVDEDEATDVTTWYTDADGDGHGDPSGPTDVDCEQPAGYAADADDCDDGDTTVYPGAVETDCDNIDNDCDGTVQESEDCDGDGVTSDEDCDDADVLNSPLLTEDCEDGADNDCDGLSDTDDALECYMYSDDDGDGMTELAGDCDDANLIIYDGAEEFEDGLDNDCNGTVDEGTDAFDDDSDGFSENDGDCDDGDSGVNPDEPESCDGQDEDCDGDIDDGTDCDEDGYSTVDNFDCDDSDPAIHPGAIETADDGIDQDCDGEDAVSEPEPGDTGDTGDSGGDSGDTGGDTGTPSEPAVDADQDGYSTILDCDDTSTLVNPAATEACADGQDNDCNGEVDETTCIGTITCSDNGSTLDVTVNGDVTTGLMAPLAGTPTEVCVTSWDTGVEVCETFAGDGTDHVFEVNLANFTPSATDGVTEEWFDLQVWKATGDCAVAEDGLGGYRVEYLAP